MQSFIEELNTASISYQSKIDIAIADDQLDEVIDVISKAAYTGKIGDGKIFVAELQRVIRIRTGETDEAAL